MSWCSRVPGGSRFYKLGQKLLGRLYAEPMGRLAYQAQMAHWLIETGVPVEGGAFFEVGTGHVPIAPIGFYLSGAAVVYTADLHRRIDWAITGQSLEWIARHRQEIEKLYAGMVRPDRLDERLSLVSRWCGKPKKFFEEARIEYCAPMDAAATDLAPQSIDCHFSVTVLEHIPGPVIAGILGEAKRLLKPGAVALHFIDLTDHFQHQDESITAINFLRFSEAQWRRIAGNEFAYCNRLRASDYMKLFAVSGFDIARIESSTDTQSLQALRDGFPLGEPFHTYSTEDLGVSALNVMLRAGGTPAARVRSGPLRSGS